MSSTHSTLGPASSAEMRGPARHLDSIVWAIFFIWVGFAMLTEMPWGWFLLGVGALILLAQLARRQMDLKIDGFWVACGIVFLAGGLWSLLALPWPLAPVLLILLGVVMLGKTIASARA